MPAERITLGQIAHARSGDKGNHANIAVVAHNAAGFDFLREELTAEQMGNFFQSLDISGVERYELPKLCALNFILRDALAGGASQSLRIDTQGKLLGTAAGELELPKPENLAEIEAPH